MICPDCGEHAHRSRARGFKERLMKKVVSARYYRCSQCGWRGRVTSEIFILTEGRKWSLLIWVAGVFLALFIGFYGVDRLNASAQLPPTSFFQDRR